jgi:hypothetical protein
MILTYVLAGNIITKVEGKVDTISRFNTTNEQVKLDTNKNETIGKSTHYKHGMSKQQYMQRLSSLSKQNMGFFELIYSPRRQQYDITYKC